jgi:flagellar motor switch protein FliN/FliY
MFGRGWSRGWRGCGADAECEEPWMAEPVPDINATQAAGVAPPPSGAGPSVDDALKAAAQTAKTISEEAASAAGGATLDLPDFGVSSGGGGRQPLDLGLLDDVSLRVKVELGRTQMYVEDVLRLNATSVVELDKAAGDPVDIYVNDRHVARGEVLVLNENFCVRISEIIPQIGAGAA